MGNTLSSCNCDRAGGHESGAVFALLAKIELQEFYEKLTKDLGVRPRYLQDLKLLEEADLDRIGLKKVQKVRLQNAIVDVRPHTARRLGTSIAALGSLNSGKLEACRSAKLVRI
jgi:hypothetical protein